MHESRETFLLCMYSTYIASPLSIDSTHASVGWAAGEDAGSYGVSRVAMSNRYFHGALARLCVRVYEPPWVCWLSRSAQHFGQAPDPAGRLRFSPSGDLGYILLTYWYGTHPVLSWRVIRR